MKTLAPKKILIVDDEHDIVELVAYNLRKEGYTVFTATDGITGLDLARQEQPDLVVLDVMMPGYDGFEVCRMIRQTPHIANTSIVFLTAKSSEIDQILGLELGADDYIQKPVSPRVHVARVKSVIRRANEQIRTETIVAPEIIQIEDIEINRQNYTVKISGVEIFFPKKEFELLAFLATNRGKVFTRESLLKRIWGESVFVVDRTVDVHVSKVREKLGKYGGYIETVKGIGYRFRP